MDILVEFQNTENLLDIIGTEIELLKVLIMKVNLVAKKAIPPRLTPHIEQDLEKYFTQKDK